MSKTDYCVKKWLARSGAGGSNTLSFETPGSYTSNSDAPASSAPPSAVVLGGIAPALALLVQQLP